MVTHPAAVPAVEHNAGHAWKRVLDEANMKISTFISGSLALALAATSITPSFAAPVLPANSGDKAIYEQVQSRSATEEEQLRRKFTGEDRQRQGERQRREEREMRRGERREERGERRGERREQRVERREQRGERQQQRRQQRIERRGNQAYYNGHRGYREQRRGYRYYEGYWFPPAAFLLGAIIASQPSYRNSDWEDHVDWCYDRYGNRYRERDNSYMSRSGYRRECVSPYY